MPFPRLDFDILTRGQDNDITTTPGSHFYEIACGRGSTVLSLYGPNSPSQSISGLCHILMELCQFMPRSGFLKMLQGALRVRPDGLAAMGIPCGSYIFMNCPTHKRTAANPFGNEALPHVATANLSYPYFLCIQLTNAACAVLGCWTMVPCWGHDQGSGAGWLW